MTGTCRVLNLSQLAADIVGVVGRVCRAVNYLLKLCNTADRVVGVRLRANTVGHRGQSSEGICGCPACIVSINNRRCRRHPRTANVITELGLSIKSIIGLSRDHASRVRSTADVTWIAAAESTAAGRVIEIGGLLAASCGSGLWNRVRDHPAKAVVGVGSILHAFGDSCKSTARVVRICSVVSRGKRTRGSSTGETRSRHRDRKRRRREEARIVGRRAGRE
jgi:hypothetical protein